MMEKLKCLVYTSKKEFVDDLDLIWANYKKYNAYSSPHLTHAPLITRKVAGSLVRLISDIVVRDRAEVEALECRFANIPADDEDSDDEPIMSSRGRFDRIISPSWL